MRKSNKKTVPTTTSTTLQLLTKFNKQDKTARLESQKLLSSKYTRSISSFGNQFRDTPEKKNTMFHHKVKSTLHKSSGNPYEGLMGIFSNCCKASSQQQLLRDISDRFHVGNKIAKEHQELYQLMKTLQMYMFQVASQLIGFHRDSVIQYEAGVREVCKQYESRVAKQRQNVIREIEKGLNEGTSQLGRHCMQINAHAIFSTKIFHEMQKQGIDVNVWISNSKLMEKFVLRVEEGESVRTSEAGSPDLKSFWQKRKEADFNQFAEEEEGTELTRKHNHTFR